MHPKTLPKHSISEFLHKNMFAKPEEFSIVSSYYHDAELEFPIGMHKHAFYEINIIVQGKGYHYIENQCFEADTGSVYVIPPNITHGYWTENNEDFKIFHLLLSAAFIERYKNELISTPGYSMLFEIEPFLRTESEEKLFLVLSPDQLEQLNVDFDKLSHLTSNDANNILKIGKTLYIIGLLSQLITAHHKSVSKSKKDASINSIAIIHTIEYMRNNYFEKILIDDLARIANMARTTYLRQFKILCKQTPNDYLTEVRVEAAANILKTSDTSLAVIAQNCGFFDSSHFSKTFKKYRGISPLDYRKGTQP